MSKIDSSLFNTQDHGPDWAHDPCPRCGGTLELCHGKHGAFVGCASYPACDYLRPLKVIEHDQDVEKVLEGSQCPLCHYPLAIKKGRYGLFIGCTHYPACHHVADINDQGQADPSCPVCSTGRLVARTSRYGKRFYACNHYPACRYVMNERPVAESCPECGFGILAERKGGLHCPNKGCGYQR
ncbi:putative DNA topoisomerase [Oceanisphaera litoralis]|uniref:DNA topoisomerase family protein n=1 Tax=Oceanisphaera litoralis TaxID=225144 RepID=UPI00195DFCC4|nr:topoisomerase DNA-binding C4 zinc finger domain-containing protein [Oceanisphaera litoralis]MBM7456169.1 putative DNA topoisomerase [Oceanisphaera litoralis]